MKIGPVVAYFHGFASGPQSSKVEYIAKQCADLGYGFIAPDLNVPDFRSLSTSAMADLIDETLLSINGPTYAVASSLGAFSLLAALSRSHSMHSNLKGIALLAPVLDVSGVITRIVGIDENTWRRERTTLVAHQAAGKQLPLDVGILNTMPEISLYSIARLGLPVLILSARNDHIVQFQDAIAIANSLPEVESKVLDTEHDFNRGFEATWKHIATFFGFGQPRASDLLFGITTADAVAKFGAREMQEITDVIDAAYGSNAYAPSIHEFRIRSERSAIVWARDIATDDHPMVGCLYVRGDGKVGACAVRSMHRRRGVASRLIRMSQEIVSARFVEISADVAGPANAFLRGGFRFVRREEILRRILDGAGHRLLAPVQEDQWSLVYTRTRVVSPDPISMRMLTAGLYDEVFG